MNDGMMSMINSLPPAPQPPQPVVQSPAPQPQFMQPPLQPLPVGSDQSFMQPLAQPMFMAPQQQQYANQPPAPQYQQPGAPQQPQAPQAPVFSPQTGYPLQIPDMQMQPQDQVPQWAQELTQSIQQIQQQQQVSPPQQDQPWDETHRPQSWEDMYKAIDQLADKKAQAHLQTFQQQQQQQVQQAQQAQQAANQQLDMIEQQLTTMGILADATTQNDPTRITKQELYGYALALGGNNANVQSLPAAAASLKALHDAGQYYDVNQRKIVHRNSQQPGAFAPIAGGTPSMSGGPAAPQAGPTQSQLATARGNLGSLAAIGSAQLGL